MNRADCLPYLRSLLPSLKGVERRLGEYLAENPEEFLKMTTARLAEKLGVEMPICDCAYGVLYEGRPVQDVVERLMTRGKRHEADESWI